MKHIPVKKNVPVNKIDGNDVTFRFRLDFPKDEILRLMRSMETQGLLNPVKLRIKDSGYQLLAGWERYIAARALKWSNIPADIYLNLTDREAYAINMADNQIRSQLSELETSNQIACLRNTQSYSVEEIAEQLGCGHQRVYDLLKLQEMKQEIRDAVHHIKISLSDAITLHKIPEEHQVTVLNRGINEGWSHRRYLAELSYIRDHPFKGYSPDPRDGNRFHAFPFVTHPGTMKVMTGAWEMINRHLGLPEPISCNTSMASPAKQKGFVCPNKAQWVVASYDTIEPSIPVRHVEGTQPTVEFIFLCEGCVKQIYPDAVYHPEYGFPELPIIDDKRALLDEAMGPNLN